MHLHNILNCKNNSSPERQKILQSQKATVKVGRGGWGGGVDIAMYIFKKIISALVTVLSGESKGKHSFAYT